MNRSNYREYGVTLVELMITVAIVAVLMLIAVPSFQNYTATQRVRGVSSDLMRAMNIARSEAAKRNATVTISAKNNDWNDGWTVALGGTTFLDHEALTQVSITETPNGTDAMQYGNNGRLVGANDISFTVASDPAVSGVSPRCVQISLSGKPKTDKGSCS